MADGYFPTLVSKDQNANAVANPVWVELTDGSAAITSTGTALDVNIASGSVTVTATDLDIRALSQTTDHVLIYGNTAKDGSGTDYVPLLDSDGKIIISNPGGTQYVEDVAAPQPATGIATLVERDDVLSAITPAAGDWSKLYCSANGALWVAVDGEVSINDGGNTITVDGTVAISGTVTVDANDLDIRDLTHVSDSVTIGDGTETMNVTAAGEAEIDIAAQSLTAVKISKDANANTELNPIYVNVVDAPVSGNEIHDYDTAAAVAGAASDNHDYSVVGGTFFLKSVIAASSGAMKIEIQTGPVGTLATVAVAFIPKHGGHDQLIFDPPVEVPVATSGTVRVIRTNREGSAQDVYSTIIGNQLA